MLLLEGFLYDEKELDEKCKDFGLNEKAEDLDGLCKERSVNATYSDLRALADSGLVHMHYSSDNYEVNELATFFEMHPYLYAEITISKETDDKKPPYKLSLQLIRTLSTFYYAGIGAEWISLITNCLLQFNPAYIEADRHEYGEENEQSCMLDLVIHY